ncbi:MAG TPA: gliding motility-associated C-terminal domain-containing protein, partial [Chitinophagaceae bacterium]|nr:gliding motility-associated C-terminal domain-containing protein [Chitinophagaceae bacterium]
CFDENSFTITITPGPIADAPQNVTSCGPYTLPALNNGNYFSKPGGVGPLAAGTVINTGQTIYVYAGTSVSCSDEHSFTVTIATKPVADAPLNVTSCVTYTLPALTNGNYFSSPGGVGPISVGTNITRTQTIYVYAATSATCFDEHSFIVTITPKPVADAPPNITSCGSYTLPALTNGNYFSSPGGVGAIPVGTVITSNRTIYVYAGSAATCFDQHSFTITIPSTFTPSVSITASSNTICEGASVTFSASFSATPTNGGPSPTYQWQINGKDIQGATSSTYSTKFLVNGDKVSVVMTSNAICTTSPVVASRQIAMVVIPRPIVNINNPVAVCAPGNINITATNITAGSDAGLSFTYFTDATASNILNNPNAVNISGTYYIKGTTAAGCATIKPVTVTVNAKPSASINGSGTLCQGLSKTLDIILTGVAPWTVTYSNGTGNFTINSITASPYKLVVSPTSNTTYSLISVIDARCSNTANGIAVISITPPISSMRYPTINAIANTPKQLQARILTPADQYTWKPQLGLNNSLISNPVFNFNKTTEYFITINSGTGCVVVDTQLVKISQALQTPALISDLFVPKAWSPNGDGHNDKLMPLLVNIKEIKYFRVFNRWGQLVFETNVMEYGWDGIFKGIPQGTDVFTWTVEGIGVDDRVHKKRGTSILLR